MSTPTAAEALADLEQLLADLDRRITALEERLDVKTPQDEGDEQPWT